jgi:Family of unknown function (DUF5681)
MSENKRDYEVGRGKPPVHSRFKKGQSGNPRGPRPKNLPALLIAALNEPVTATIDGERREITKREAVVTQLVNKSPPIAGDQDADRHAEGRREEGRRDAALRARPVHCGGRGGDGDLHRQAAAILGRRSFGKMMDPTSQEGPLTPALSPRAGRGRDPRSGRACPGLDPGVRGNANGPRQDHPKHIGDLAAARFRHVCAALFPRAEPAEPVRDELAYRDHRGHPRNGPQGPAIRGDGVVPRQDPAGNHQHAAALWRRSSQARDPST